MSNEEQKEDSIETKPYKQIKKEIEEEDDDKEKKLSKDEPNDKFETKEKINTRFKPKIKLDMIKQRYPYCLVWTPLPCITWLFPSIGHVGICTSKGIIHDFAGSRIFQTGRLRIPQRLDHRCDHPRTDLLPRTHDRTGGIRAGDHRAADPAGGGAGDVSAEVKFE